ncbi:hypothetical protein I6N91_12205 [Arthrobacter sp. MSA 4-2]|uniref:hypothetical protein n=1 Tax=Arthrobacter sp. MSA 4-2 TaxID=2794349 RepID=UPI0018E7C347|nr:hypothetical protein [Arthrobacter sp. MSA 4-2]MBJ2121742.1 hypothetical protein [Arthrobacter sp. MSA 4-2]
MPDLDDERIKRIMVAAADLENAEFERDRLALVCREAVERALEAGVSAEDAAAAAGIAERDVERLVGAPQADEVVPLLTAQPVPPVVAPVQPVAAPVPVDGGGMAAAEG